jgi:hypothetical protein
MVGFGGAVVGDGIVGGGGSGATAVAVGAPPRAQRLHVVSRASMI